MNPTRRQLPNSIQPDTPQQGNPTTMNQPNNPHPAIPYRQALQSVNYHRRQALVVSTSSAQRQWSQISHRRDLDLDLTDCLDRAPAVALGLALAQPNRKILTLDCDATLRTNLSGLATIGESRPQNLIHLVFDDTANPSTNGQPIKEQTRLNLPQIALSAGYQQAYHFNQIEELLIGLEQALTQNGPTFILITVHPEPEPDDAPNPPILQPSETWPQLRQRLLTHPQ